jgi:hypothetical protein
MIIGLSGLISVGKDTVADILVKHHKFQKVSLADPMKRSVMEWFDWPVERLWGPSKFRSVEDPRYPGLTARKVLQLLGTEVGRNCYPDVWADYAMRVAKALLKNGVRYRADLGPMHGGTNIEENIAKGVVISDVRFKNEMNAIRAAGGKVIRIKRPGKETPEWNHASETEQLSVPDEWFDYVFINDGSLWGLEDKVATMLSHLGEKNES